MYVTCHICASAKGGRMDYRDNGHITQLHETDSRAVLSHRIESYNITGFVL